MTLLLPQMYIPTMRNLKCLYIFPKILYILSVTFFFSDSKVPILGRSTVSLGTHAPLVLRQSSHLICKSQHFQEKNTQHHLPRNARQNKRKKMKRWMKNQHLGLWRGPCSTQRQARELISVWLQGPDYCPLIGHKPCKCIRL